MKGIKIGLLGVCICLLGICLSLNNIFAVGLGTAGVLTALIGCFVGNDR